MPVAARGRREAVGAQPRRAHRVQAAEQFGVGVRVAHRARRCRRSVRWAARPCCSQPGIALSRVSTASSPGVGDLRDTGRDVVRRGDRVRGRPGGQRGPPPQRDHRGLLLVPAVHAQQHRQPALRGEPHGAGGGAGHHDAAGRRSPSQLVGARHHRHLAEGGSAGPARPPRARAASAAAGRATRGSRSRRPRGPAPKTSRSTQGPPRPTPSVKRPPEARCSSAACSPSATGCAVGSTLTAVPTPMRRVRPSSSTGEGDSRRADPVRHEVVFGQPHGVEAGRLGGLGGGHRPVQRLALALTGELGRQHEGPNSHRALPP